jgi:hypothetical protein
MNNTHFRAPEGPLIKKLQKLNFSQNSITGGVYFMQKGHTDKQAHALPSIYSQMKF